MPTYKIYFLGLVCHVGDSPQSKRYAAIVNAPGHRAILMTKAAQREIEPGEHVRFSETEGTADTDGVFRKNVPSLFSAMRGRLGLSDQSPVGTDAAYVHFPAGSRLRAAHLYPMEAVYSVNGVSRRSACVAKVTLLEIDAAGLVMTVDGKPVAFGDDHCAKIANVLDFEFNAVLRLFPMIQSGDYSRVGAVKPALPLVLHDASHHFNLYGRIVEGEDTVVVDESGTQTCTQVLLPVPDWVDKIVDITVFSGVNIGCGNTNWP